MKKIVIDLKIEADIKQEVIDEINALEDKEKFLNESLDEFRENLDETVEDLFNQDEFENISREINIKFE